MATPAVVGDTVYIATNAGGVVAVDRRTGRTRWKLALPGPTWGSPVVVDGVLVEGDCRGNLPRTTSPGAVPRALVDPARRLHRVDPCRLARPDLHRDARRRVYALAARS